MTSGEAAREHLGQLTAVGPARAPSPGNRLPLWRALGERTWMRGQQWRSGKARHPRRRRRRSWGGGGKSFRGATHNSDWDAALAAAPIGQASPRSAASAELPAAAGEAAFTEIHWKGALARAERAGKAPARLGLVLRLCVLVSLKRPRGSAAPPDGHSRRAREPLAGRHDGGRAGGGPAGRLGPRLCSGGGRKGPDRSADGGRALGGRARGRPGAVITFKKFWRAVPQDRP